MKKADDREAAPERHRRVPDRPVGGEPLRGVAARQGISHPSAALSFARGRDRHHRTPARRHRVRRGQGPRDARRGRLRDHAGPAAAHRCRRRGMACEPSAICQRRLAFRRDADRARPAAASSRGGVRRDAIVMAACLPCFRCGWKVPAGSHRLPPRKVPSPSAWKSDEPESRRPDGPHRPHQHPRRFDLCDAAGGAKARACHQLLHARQAGAARPRHLRHRAAA